MELPVALPDLPPRGVSPMDDKPPTNYSELSTINEQRTGLVDTLLSNSRATFQPRSTRPTVVSRVRPIALNLPPPPPYEPEKIMQTSDLPPPPKRQSLEPFKPKLLIGPVNIPDVKTIIEPIPLKRVDTPETSKDVFAKAYTGKQQLVQYLRTLDFDRILVKKERSSSRTRAVKPYSTTELKEISANLNLPNSVSRKELIANIVNLAKTYDILKE